MDNHQNSDNCSISSLTNRKNNSSKNGSLTRSIGAISVGDESPNIGAFWKRHLFLLQEQAPKPTVVVCRTDVRTRPFFYSNEYHGLISREMSDKLLASAGEGSYLVRESQRAPGMYTLCMRFDDVTKNYKLFYDGSHYVGEKRFETLDDLVADGLISMYIDKHAADYIRRMAEETIYEETPYSQYRRMHENKNNRDGNKAKIT